MYYGIFKVIICVVCLFLFIKFVMKYSSSLITGGVKTSYVHTSANVVNIIDRITNAIKNNETLSFVDNDEKVLYDVINKYCQLVKDKDFFNDIITPVTEAVVATYYERNHQLLELADNKYNYGASNIIFNVRGLEPHPDEIKILRLYRNKPIHYENKMIPVTNNKLNAVNIFSHSHLFPKVYFSSNDIHHIEDERMYDTNVCWMITERYDEFNLNENDIDSDDVLRYAETMIKIMKLIQEKGLMYYDWKIYNTMINKDDEFVLIDTELFDMNNGYSVSHEVSGILKAFDLKKADGSDFTLEKRQRFDRLILFKELIDVAYVIDYANEDDDKDDMYYNLMKTPVTVDELKVEMDKLKDGRIKELLRETFIGDCFDEKERFELIQPMMIMTPPSMKTQTMTKTNASMSRTQGVQERSSRQKISDNDVYYMYHNLD